MTKPEEIRRDARTMKALMDMFDRSFMGFVNFYEEPGNPNLPEEKENAVVAFYHLEELVAKIQKDMEQLAQNMEICEVIYAASAVRRGRGK